MGSLDYEIDLLSRLVGVNTESVPKKGYNECSQLIIDEARSGFNSFIKEQREVEGDANVTVALFDNGYDLVHSNVRIEEVEDISHNDN